MKRVNVAVVGAAGWIGGLHSDCWVRAKSLSSDAEIHLHTAVDINEEAVRKVAARYGYAHWSIDYNEVIDNPEVDLVDICCDNNLHKEIAVKAANKGKLILCEKPMATNYPDAKEMADAVRDNNIQARVGFMFRKYPSVAFIRQLIDRGDIGELRQFKVFFEQDSVADPGLPYNWRFCKKTAGGGSIVGLGSHIIDISRYFMGEFDEVCAELTTFINERPMRDDKSKMGRVDVDDMSMVLVKFKNGGTGALFTSLVTHGKKHHMEFQLAGSKATVIFNSERMNEVQIYEAEGSPDKRGFKTIFIGELHPYGELFSQKAGMGIGTKEGFTLQMVDYLKDAVNGTVNGATFDDGLKNVLCIEKIQESAERGNWVKVEA